MDSKVKQQQVQETQQQEISNYRLLHVIGRGGFADVYLAEHSYLQTRVALKIFRTRPGDEQMERFLVQVRKLARLHHEHILPILSCDVRDGSPFLVLPYATGGTLRQRHPRGSQLTMEVVLTYLRQIAPALDAAHRAGQIHGDIKPENRLLGEQDKLLLSDFGLAPVVENMPGRTQAPVTGTVTYMAPEQLAGQLEAASDQYALAILVYEWLCGEPPFAGTYTEVATQHALIDPPSLRQRRPDLAPQVEQVLSRALAKDPRERFSSVRALARAARTALIAVGDTPGEARVREGASQQNRGVLRDHSSLGACVAWSPDCPQLAAAYADIQTALIVAFWHIASGNRLPNLQITG